MSGARHRHAIVLFNLGGPDNPDAVRPFLYNLFKDKAIITAPALIRFPLAALISSTRAKSARANYALMGGGSPLLPETEKQAEALRQRLCEMAPDEDTEVFIAMRYWHPFVETTAKAVAKFAPDRVTLLPLYPHFSTTTTGSSLGAWSKAYKGPGHVRLICCYPEAEDFIQSHADRINEAWQQAESPSGLRLLFSAHGLPEKVILAGDPYQSQIERTAAKIAAKLPQFQDWSVCYQSRVGPLKWIGPSTIEALTAAGLEGKGVIITPIAFVSEHVETLVELDHEYGEMAKGVGVAPYVRVPALGVAPAFIEALAAAATSGCAFARGPFGGPPCEIEHGACPYRVGERADG